MEEINNDYQFDSYEKRLQKIKKCILDVNNYKEICNMFMNLDLTDDQKQVLSKILYEGKYADYEIPLIFDINPFSYQEYFALARLSFADLYLKNPETFMELVNNGIYLFHGTTSDALPNIFVNGLISHQKANDLGIEVTTGEEFSRFNNICRSFVSFSNILEVAETYSLIDADDEEKILSFPVVIGVKSEYDKLDVPHGDIPEVRSWDNIPLDEIAIIMVPSSKIEIVKKMAGELKIKILPLDNIRKKFYSMEHFFNPRLLFNENRYEVIKNTDDYSNIFGLKDVKSLVFYNSDGDIHKKIEKQPKYKETEIPPVEDLEDIFKCNRRR